MTDSANFDINEKVNILIKQSFGFPTTSEDKEWYEETAIQYNNYLNGEELLIDIIPDIPDFDICGNVINASDIGLDENDFLNYNNNVNDIANCSIVDDSTGTVRRYNFLILNECPQLGNNAGSSWYKLDVSGNNILKNAFQFNYKQYEDDIGNIIQPYLYGLYTENSNDQVIPFGKKGGNWFFDIKSGVIFFSDFENFSNGIQNNSIFQITNNNKPVLTFYNYIGKKGINNLIENININNNHYKIIQILSTNITTSISDEIIDDLSYENIAPLSLSVYPKKNNSKYKILLNFNYEASSTVDTFLYIKLYYKLNTEEDVIIGEYKLGSENTNFRYDFFSNNFYLDISSTVNDIIYFNVMARIDSDTHNKDYYDNLSDELKPKILFSLLGNILNIEEINI